MPLARFVTLHAVPEEEQSNVGSARFAVVLARTSAGVVLVLNHWRKVWELPGGLLDPGESLRECAARELREEAGCTASPRSLEWLGLLEVNDGRAHFGAAYACDVDTFPRHFTSEETDAIAFWTPATAPHPLGESDAVLLKRFGSPKIPQA